MDIVVDIDDSKYSKIPLRNKKKEIINYAIIDKEDYEKVNKYKWHCCKSKKKNSNHIYYSVTGKVNKQSTRLSHFILEKPTPPNVVDHINNNTFDNRKENLRIVSQKINGQNKKKKNNGLSTSKYIGVSLVKNTGKWQSRYADTNLGFFTNEIDAALNYDKYVLINFGRYASTNNLVKYEDTIDLNNNDILPDKKKIGNLPKNITLRDNLYKVSITYNKKIYKECTKTLEEAIQILEKFKKTIEIIKANELLEHNKLDILRNIEGEAIINIYNKKKEVINSIIVDDDKWHEFSLHKWNNGDGYVFSKINGKSIRMTRYLLNAPDNVQVDHINNNIHDNRITNLRLATDKQNSYNKSSCVNSSSLYKGLSKRISTSNNITYKVQIEKEGKYYGLGTYTNEIVAAIAYNIKAKELFGNFAYLNKIEIDKNLYDQYKNSILEKWAIPKNKYRGIKKRLNSFYACIKKDGKEYGLGTYKIETIAALAYNIKYIEFFGEDNTENLNIIDVDDDLLLKYKEEIFAKWKKLKIGK